MRKWTALALVILVAGCATLALGQESKAATQRQWDQVCADFGLRTLVEAPPGITPQAVSSPSELRQILSGLSAAVRGTVQVQVTASDSFTPLAYGPTESCVSKSWYVSLTFYERFYLWADIWIIGSGSFWEISDDTTEWVGLTGMTVFEELVNDWHYHVISPDHQQVTVKGGGVLNHYFLIKGFIKMYSTPVSVTGTYHL